jgi:hypothetical protein
MDFTELLIRFFGIESLYSVTNDIELIYVVTDRYRSINPLNCTIRKIKQKDFIF